MLATCCLTWASYPGYTPPEARRFGRLTKEGPPLVRNVLVQAAYPAIRKSLEGYLRQNQGEARIPSRIAVARKLATLAYHTLKGVLTSRQRVAPDRLRHAPVVQNPRPMLIERPLTRDSGPLPTCAAYASAHRQAQDEREQRWRHVWQRRRLRVVSFSPRMLPC